MVGVAFEPRQILREFKRRIMGMVGRAVLQAVDDGKRMQSVQVVALRGQVIDDAERFQDYGFTSNPHPGAEAVLLAVGGVRQHPIVVKIDDRRYRVVGLNRGEVAIYTDEHEETAEHLIHLKRGRVIELRCGTTVLKLEPDGMTLTTPSGTQTWGTA